MIHDYIKIMIQVILISEIPDVLRIFQLVYKASRENVN